LHKKDDLKIVEFPSSFPSLRQGWLEGQGDDQFKWITI